MTSRDHHSTILALSPLDGRYAPRLEKLRELFSEYGLIHHRLKVELAWWQRMCALSGEKLPPDAMQFLHRLGENFSPDQALQVKELELKTRHDVKALEYWIQGQVKDHQTLSALTHFIHFACTSEDINNLAYGMMLIEGRHLLQECFDRLLAQLATMVRHYAALPMLSRTHGQAATPTTLGKELGNFVYRLHREQWRKAPLLGKFNGAVGNFNAHLLAYPEVDWLGESRTFVESLGLQWNPMTTQIESHDALAAFLDALSRTNVILLDLCRDFWLYISQDYFHQELRAGEVGSSTMPHKINPIDFENAEGNLGIANSLLRHMAEKLPISRLQRDLSDSTVQRNLGVALGHTQLAWDAITTGLARLQADERKMAEDLSRAWPVLTEAVQTLMRRHGVKDAYEQMKHLSRGRSLTREEYLAAVRALPIGEEAREILARLTPQNYLGLAPRLAVLFASLSSDGAS